MSGAVLVAAGPLLAAALLGFLPERAGAWVGFGAAVVALACAVAAGGTDALGTLLALLAAFVGVTTAWFAARRPEAAPAAGNALFQAALGGALLATLADDPALGWLGLALGAAAMAGAGMARVRMAGASGLLAAGWRCLSVCGVALLLVLVGIVVLRAAAPAPGWVGMARMAPGADPVTLNLAACFLLAGWGALAALAPVHAWLVETQDGGAAISGVLSTLLLNAALANLLRLRDVMAACPGALAPGGALVALGLLSLLGAALLLWRERDAWRLLGVSTVGQGGLVAVAFGLGGTAARAGLLHLVLHTLAKAALWQGVGRGTRAGAAVVLAAGISVAGLPPAGVFASQFLVLAEAMRQAPAIALLAGLGVGAGAWALLARLHALTPTGARPQSVVTLLGAWANLTLALLLGLMTPGPVVALLRAAVP